MNRKERRALQHSKIGHTAEYTRLVKQRATISRTQLHHRYDMIPKVTARYMGLNRTVCVSRVVRTPNQSSHLPASMRLPKL